MVVILFLMPHHQVRLLDVLLLRVVAARGVILPARLLLVCLVVLVEAQAALPMA
jgi:hypothetical protein